MAVQRPIGDQNYFYPDGATPGDGSQTAGGQAGSIGRSITKSNSNISFTIQGNNRIGLEDGKDAGQAATGVFQTT